MFSSPLQRALSRGMKENGDLADQLRELGNYPIRSRKDAKAICDALGKLPLRTPDAQGNESPLQALVGLFQDIESRDAPAFDVLYHEGLAHLIRIFDATVRIAADEADDLLFILKILAMYGSREGADKIVEAARRPLNPDAYMWSVIISIFSKDHPHRDLVFEALGDPLPSEFLAVALLDSANHAAIEGDLQHHPFDSAEGHKRLQNWLEDRDPENSSYAHSATAALPFVSNPARDQLLALAMDHVNSGVQIEAAWAAGRLGREGGLKVLSRFCLDVKKSDVAQRYLAELGRQDFIPAEAQEPSFQAKATFAQWLAHPNELGEAPDEIEIVDQRELAWPPDREPQPFWLLRYRLRDRSGLEEDQEDCGLVGSMTWCFFSYEMTQRPPEDVYAIHCCWEMENQKLIVETDVTDSAEYPRAFEQWQGAPIEQPQIMRVVEVSPKLKYPNRLVFLASGKIEGQAGWVVLDGTRSAWYPQDEQPDAHESAIWRIHIGLNLLGLRNSPDRKKHLIVQRPIRDPQQFITAYEKLIAEAEHAAPKRQKELLDMGLLSRNFDAYVDALATVRGSSTSETTINAYQRFLQLAQRADDSVRGDVLDSHSLLGNNFDAYINALVVRGRLGEVLPIVELFSPLWNHNLGNARLGSAAFKAGRMDVAEQYFVKLRNELKDCCRSEEMGLLAEIWHNRGEVEAARGLLVDCLRGLVKLIKESKYNSDRKMYADEFAHHRSTYLRLFPGSEAQLRTLRIPEVPL